MPKTNARTPKLGTASKELALIYPPAFVACLDTCVGLDV